MRTLTTIVIGAFLAASTLAQETEKIVTTGGDRISEETVYTEIISDFKDVKTGKELEEKINIEKAVNLVTLYDGTIEDEEELREQPLIQGLFTGFSNRIEKDEMRIRRKFLEEGYEEDKFPFEAQLGDALWDYAVANNILWTHKIDEGIKKAQDLTTVSYTTKKGRKYKFRYQFDEFNKDHPGRIRITGSNLKYIDNLTVKVGIEDIELSTERKLPHLGDNSRLVLQLGYYGETRNGDDCPGDCRLFITFETSSLFFWKDPEDQKKYYKPRKDNSTKI